MKKKLKKIIAIITLLITFITTPTFANEATNTWTMSVDGEFIRTQTAYEAIAILTDEFISRPEDLFIDERGYLFVADSRLGHIAIYNPNRELVDIVGNEVLDNPTGVFVKEYIYVADTNYVYKFNFEGQLINQFGRPDSPLFGRTQPFRPRKIAVDARGNMSIISEAASNGIIQLNASGEFLGYFGANQTTLTFFQAIQNFFLGQTRFANIPIPPTNIDIASNGAIFTVTAHLPSERVKMLNIAGNNMIGNIGAVMHEAVDITLGNQGNFYVLYSTGMVDEFDSSGNLLFSWGGQETGANRFGILRQPTSIVVAENGNIYIADAESGFIHIFSPTEFTNKVHHALSYFEEGLYTISEAYWQDVLRLNGSFGLAHLAIAQSRFIQGDFHEARTRFYLAQDIAGYSESFWEIRHEWLLNYTASMILVIIVILIVTSLVKVVDKKNQRISAWKSKIDLRKKFKIIEDFALACQILKKPIDVFYAIKRERRGSIRVAIILYCLAYLMMFTIFYFAGFVFATDIIDTMGIITLTVFFVLGFSLFVIVNYLVSTISDGEGRFSDVFVGTAYSLIPFIFLALPITISSRILTLNEAFVYTFLIQIALGWCLLLLFLMVKEIHDFEFGQTIKNILLTLGGSMVIVVVSFLLYILLIDQLIDFIYSIIWEVLIRV